MALPARVALSETTCARTVLQLSCCMFGSLKLMRLSSALKNQRDSQAAYNAVLELGRIRSDKAIDLLIGCLGRDDGVARNAARELGRIADSRAIKPLAEALANAHTSQSAAEALGRFGAQAVDALHAALKSSNGDARRIAAEVLGAIRDKRSVEPLIEIMQTDDDYAVRTAAAKALGDLKDARALWVIVGTLKLRDEATPECQLALDKLRQAALSAWRKIGDPLGKGTNPESVDIKALTAELQEDDPTTNVHPKLAGDLAGVADADIVAVLKELIAASEEVSWAKLESREPMLQPWFASYDERRQLAETLGTELRRRGGGQALREILQRDLGSNATIENWWQSAELM